MTAFARQESQHRWGGLVWEIRSVNHRYLESNLRIPDSFRDIESALRDQLRKKLNRGKIDGSLRFDVEKQQQGIQVDKERAQQLIAAAEQLSQLTSNPQPIDTLEILRWPGVMLDTKLDMREVKQVALQLFSQAIDDLNQGRIREGQELAELIEQRLTAISLVCLLYTSPSPRD